MHVLTSLARQRQWFSGALILVVVGGVLWHFSPGIPVLWEPSASAADREAGQMLFEHAWLPNDPLAGGDGLGPVFNATSCVACHFQGGVGGGGTRQQNVVTYEIQPTPGDPQIRSGTIHACATEPSFQESQSLLRGLHPILKGETRTLGTPECPYTIVIPDFDPVATGNLNPTALFGAGWVDRISSKAIRANRRTRMLAAAFKEVGGEFNIIPAGRPRLLPDGRVGKFGWKAQFATLEEFIASACANELGLSNPLMNQAAPLGQGGAPNGATDLDRKQFAQLVAFLDTLERPSERVPEDAGGQTRAMRGKQLFHEVGCAVCHTPDLGGVQGVYSDFLLYSLENPTPQGNSYQGQEPRVPVPDGQPKPEEWKTPPLWGVADSAPYFHDGGSPTLQTAILRHRGDASAVTAAFTKLSAQDQEAVIAFLQTLKAPGSLLIRGGQP